ncbi:MAG: site-specific integrase [Candidatus Levybacteria bacterium]|nr:site-specific integrase [Candidatus Levybacteria bacterium]
MKLPELFRTYLLSKKSLSNVTAKNYASDIRKFIVWFETSFEKTFQSQDLTSDVITLFDKTHPFPPRSQERYISSLRRFGLFLTEEGYIKQNPFDTPTTDKEQLITDKWFLKDFKDYLYVYGASNLTIKNYLVDINALTNWLENRLKTDLNISLASTASPRGEAGHRLEPGEASANLGGEAYIGSITSEIIDEYKQRLIYSLKLSPKTINRKLSSIRKYLEFAVSQDRIKEQLKTENLKLKTDPGVKLEDIGQIDKSQLSVVSGQWSKVPPVRLFQILLIPYILFEDFIVERLAQFIKHRKLLRKAEIRENQLLDPRKSISNIPIHIQWHKKLIHHAKYTRPNWYKAYHSYTFTHYFHLALLIAYASAIGFMLYNNLFSDPREKSALAGPIGPKRVLSFQGRLTDAADNPIITATDIRFGIYESQTATGSALLWQEVHSAVTPDSDGIFSILLGTKNEIQGGVFRDHDLLWLGITIGKTAELTPRQRLAAVAYATNTENLQGMLPITDNDASTTNVVLALDSSGNLTIAGTAAPTFAATGGRFKLSGTTLLLSTEESSNGDIDIVPDGTGKIDIHKPIINDTATGNLIGGAVEINDKVAILATESAVAAFVINNNTTGGDIITASSSGTTRFILANDGDLTLNGADTITASSLSTFTTAEILSLSQDLAILGNDITNTVLNFGGGAPATLGTVSDDSLTIAPHGTGQLILASDFDTGVNIGTSTNTKAPLSISGGIGSNAALIVNQTNSGDIFSASSSGTTKFVLGSSGTITLTSGITESALGQYLCINTTTYEVGRSNSACSASSVRFKENINDLASGLSDVLNLHPVTFTFKPEMNMGSDVQVGFIAEEVEKIIPELVSYDSQGRPSGVNYTNMTAVLTRAIQELAQRLETTTDSVTIAGQTLRDYISSVVSEVVSGQMSVVSGNEIVSPLASIDRIHTNVISPLASDSKIALDVRNSKLEIRNSASASESAVVASIDNQGNASFSGTLSAESLETQDASISGQLAADNVTANIATISGTLYADNIQANSIEGLEEKVKSITSTMGTESAHLARDTLDTLDTRGTLIFTDFVDIENLSADFATFRVGMISLGPATLTQATILDSLSIGTSLMIGPNSIDTLGEILEIQPLKQGAISFMAGAVRIETDGTLKVTSRAEFASDVKIKGELSASIISPVSDAALVIARGAKQSHEVASDSANPRDYALLDIQGAASVSGALTSRKLNLAFAEQAFATSDIEATASGSAGTAFLKQYRNEITIKNPNVTEKSLIYITPVGNTNNKVLYLLRQIPEDPNIEGLEGSFTVGVNTASTATDIKFNWIIVN